MTIFPASLAKWLSVRLQIKWLWVRIPLLSDIASASTKVFLDIQASYRVWIQSETRTSHNNNIQ